VLWRFKVELGFVNSVLETQIVDYHAKTKREAQRIFCNIRTPEEIKRGSTTPEYAWQQQLGEKPRDHMQIWVAPKTRDEYERRPAEHRHLTEEQFYLLGKSRYEVLRQGFVLEVAQSLSADKPRGGDTDQNTGCDINPWADLPEPNSSAPQESVSPNCNGSHNGSWSPWWNERRDRWNNDSWNNDSRSNWNNRNKGNNDSRSNWNNRNKRNNDSSSNWNNWSYDHWNANGDDRRNWSYENDQPEQADWSRWRPASPSPARPARDDDGDWTKWSSPARPARDDDDDDWTKWSEKHPRGMGSPVQIQYQPQYQPQQRQQEEEFHHWTKANKKGIGYPVRSRSGTRGDVLRVFMKSYAGQKNMKGAVNIYRHRCGDETTVTQEEAMELKRFIPKVLQDYSVHYLELIGADALMGSLIIRWMKDWQKDPAWQTITTAIKVYEYAELNGDFDEFPFEKEKVAVTVFRGDAYETDPQGKVFHEQRGLNLFYIAVPTDVYLPEHGFWNYCENN